MKFKLEIQAEKFKSKLSNIKVQRSINLVLTYWGMMVEKYGVFVFIK